MYPNWICRLIAKCTWLSQELSNGGGRRLNLMHNVRKNKNAWKHMKWFGMSKWAQSLALEPLHDLKRVQWRFEFSPFWKNVFHFFVSNSIVFWKNHKKNTNFIFFKKVVENHHNYLQYEKVCKILCLHILNITKFG